MSASVVVSTGTAQAMLYEIVPELKRPRASWKEAWRKVKRVKDEKTGEIWYIGKGYIVFASIISAIVGAFIGALLGLIWHAPGFTSLIMSCVGLVAFPFNIVIGWVSQYREDTRALTWEPPAPAIVKNKIMAHYRGKFDDRKAQLVGDRSRFAQDQQRLRRALDSAQEGRAYWEGLIAQNGETPDSKQALVEIIELEQVFANAITSMDRQREKILEVIRRANTYFSLKEATATQISELERIRHLRSEARNALPAIGNRVAELTAGLVNEFDLLEGVLSRMDRVALMEFARDDNRNLQPLYEYARLVGARESHTEQVTTQLISELESAAE